MKTLKNILESIDIKPTKVKETSSYKEIWYQFLGVRLKSSIQQSLIDGYITKVQRSYWDESDKKSEIRTWQNSPMVFDNLSADIKQFGKDDAIMSITIAASNPKDRWNSFRDVITYIRIPNPDKKEFTIDELAAFANNVIDKIQSKTSKVIKFMANNWNLPNEYTDYNKFIKL